MDDSILVALRLAEGPVFRFALALAILALARNTLLSLTDVAAVYFADRDHTALWRKLRLRFIWIVFPTLIFHQAGCLPKAHQFLYHTFFSCVSLVFRLCVILVPTFMVAHVHLWKRALGISWPAFPGMLADTLSYVTIATGFLLFLGRVYSPTLRRFEPAWAYFKPLVMIVPFLTGVLAMHPKWCPIDYHVMMLGHVLSASFVITILPFARLFSLHVRLWEVLPEAAWRLPEKETSSAPTEPWPMTCPTSRSSTR